MNVDLSISQTNGIPTINGWHSFVSGEVSSFTGINMIQSQYNAMDDFPSKFRQQGYHSMIVWPNTFKTDQSQNYVFRDKKQVSGPKNVVICLFSSQTRILHQIQDKIVNQIQLSINIEYSTSDYILTYVFSLFKILFHGQQPQICVFIFSDYSSRLVSDENESDSAVPGEVVKNIFRSLLCAHFLLNNYHFVSFNVLFEVESAFVLLKPLFAEFVQNIQQYLIRVINDQVLELFRITILNRLQN
ncbi:Sulfatase [Hexamita inflata]|uniref:Sulfatase n=1 Tax=Hexamita inflata TaxID=28002 RepID=A0ABP1HHQ7_9EUKA